VLPKLDLHTHSIHSDGHQTFEEIFREAQRKRLKVVAVTDHHTNTGSLEVYEHTSDLEHIKTLKDQCRTISNGADTQMLLGIEADIIDLDGCLNIRPEIAAEVDFVIASLHVIPGIEMNPEKEVRADPKEVVIRCIRSEIAAVKNGHADVLGHPMYVVSAGRNLKSMNDVPDGLLTELAETAAKHDVALEINGHFYRDVTPPIGYFDLFEICLKNGVKLSTGSDAHQPLYVGDLSKIHATLTQLKAKPSDIYSPVE